MSPETRTKLKNTLADHGLTVMQSKDHSAMLQELARLAQFERLMLTTAAGNPPVESAVEHVILCQLESAATPVTDTHMLGDMTLDDIPRVMREAHAGLHSYQRRQGELFNPKTAPDLIDGALEIARSGRALNNLGYIRTGLINAAVAALVGVISIDRSHEAPL